jgi:hypothetical protein
VTNAIWMQFRIVLFLSSFEISANDTSSVREGMLTPPPRPPPPLTEVLASICPRNQGKKNHRTEKKDRLIYTSCSHIIKTQNHLISWRHGDAHGTHVSCRCWSVATNQARATSCTPEVFCFFCGTMKSVRGCILGSWVSC